MSEENLKNDALVKLFRFGYLARECLDLLTDRCSDRLHEVDRVEIHVSTEDLCKLLWADLLFCKTDPNIITCNLVNVILKREVMIIKRCTITKLLVEQYFFKNIVLNSNKQ